MVINFIKAYIHTHLYMRQGVEYWNENQEKEDEGVFGFAPSNRCFHWDWYVI